MNILLLLTALLSVSLYDEAISLNRKMDFEKSNKLLTQLELEFGHEPKFLFYKAVNYFEMNRHKECLHYLKKLEQSSFDIPERYVAVSMLMLEELQRWQEDDLDEIARLMKESKNKLRNNYASKPVQILQKKIVDKLDKMIEDLEKQAEEDDSDKDENSQQPQPPQNPLDQSRIKTDVQGKGLIQKIELRKKMEKWGSLPPIEQQRIVQQMTEGLSPSDRAVIENYLRELSKRKK